MPQQTPSDYGMQRSPSFASMEELYQIIGELFVTRGKTNIEYRNMLFQADEMANVITQLREQLEAKDVYIARLVDALQDTKAWQIGQTHS